jgi:hypothetical protein
MLHKDSMRFSEKRLSAGEIELEKKQKMYIYEFDLLKNFTNYFPQFNVSAVVLENQKIMRDIKKKKIGNLLKRKK